MKVLALTLHRKDRSPGQRYRIEQYISFLNTHGITIHFSSLLRSQIEDETFYKGGNILVKSFIGIKAFTRRLFDIFNISNYDYIFIFRDAFFFGTFIEKTISFLGKKIIYDFDDSIWLMDKNENQGIFNKLKNPQKTATLCKLADTVIVGNEYLAKFARQHNSNVKIIPSTIDLSTYQISDTRLTAKVCIGWTGSFSTIKHFETVLPALLKIKNIYKEQVYFKLIGDTNYLNKGLDIRGIPWNSETEAKDLSELDIGIMPLPDNDWTRGKCGMKGLQYMALGIAAILSPVGVNNDIVQDGINGFLASDEEEWIEKISRLIEEKELRKKMGISGKKTVEEEFSVEANKDKWLDAFTNSSAPS